jgi:5-methylcytosine-specific restriction enzyme subunit McrC
LAPAGVARIGDYYQLLAYCTALNLAEGVLIYAQTDDEEPERQVVVRHAGTRLVTYRLELSGGAAEIEGAVEGLASWVALRASAA